MNTMFFSVKERMGEIGIKKSLGASKWDITVQFMLEGVFMALMAGIVAGLYGIVFSFLPSFYGANIKVVDALRFE